MLNQNILSLSTQNNIYFILNFRIKIFFFRHIFYFILWFRLKLYKTYIVTLLLFAIVINTVTCFFHRSQTKIFFLINLETKYLFVMPIVMTLFLCCHPTTITTTTTSTVDRLKASTRDSRGIKSWTMGMTLLSRASF